MTQWVENPTGGRERGPIALARAWLEVLVRPRRFFRTGVAPGDQASGLVFVCTIVFVFEATRFALVVGSYPVVAGRPLISAVLWLIVAVAFVAPLVLHLVAAIETVALISFTENKRVIFGVLALVTVVGFAAPLALHFAIIIGVLVILLPLADERAGVSETVQVIAYATAPCVFAGLPIPVIRVVCTAYGAALLVVGTSEVHDIGLGRAAIAGALPTILVFGYAFSGFGAAASLLPVF